MQMCQGKVKQIPIKGENYIAHGTGGYSIEKAECKNADKAGGYLGTCIKWKQVEHKCDFTMSYTYPVFHNFCPAQLVATPPKACYPVHPIGMPLHPLSRALPHPLEWSVSVIWVMYWSTAPG